jgi:hypothetical protein
MVKSLKQFIFKDKIFICGNAAEVMETLKNLSGRFCTVKELLDFYANEL